MIKQFESFGAYNQIKEWLDEFKIKNYTINDDLTVDVNGDVIIKQSDLEEIPIQFNNVYGDFDASDNRLTSLKGCPKYVKNMYLISNKLTSLKGCPEYVDDELYLSYNRLANLNYSPKYIGGEFFYRDNYLPNDIDWFLARGDVHTKTLLKYQEEYALWKDDGTLNNERWRIFYNDFKDGILN